MYSLRVKFFLFSLILLLGFSNGVYAQNGLSCSDTMMMHKDGSGTLGLTYSNTDCGLDYVTYSFRSTSRHPSLVGTGFPAAATISGIPASASVIQTFIWWGGSFLAGDPRIVINADTLTGSTIGTGLDKCWGKAGTENFRVDATAYINTNGVYSINCLQGDYSVDGVTIMVIYKDTTANFSGTLIIEDGCIVRLGGNSLDTFDIVSPPLCQPTNGKVFCINSDMQIIGAATHVLTVNGTPTTFPNQFWNFSETTAFFSAAQASFPMVLAPTTGDCYNWVLTGSYFRNIGPSGCVTSVTECPQVICSGDSILITAVPGPVGSTFLWSCPTETLSDSLSQSIYVTPTGSSAVYTCTTTFPDLTTADTTYMIIVNQSPNSGVLASNETCSGLNNGTIAISTNAFAPYTILLNGNPAPGSPVINLAPGSYLVSVTDFYGCNVDTLVNINPGPPDFSDALFVSDTMICNDTITGIITPTVPAAYTYDWSPNISNSNPNDSLTYFTTLNNGNNPIALTITHPNGCVHTYNFNLIFSSMSVSSINVSPDTSSVCLYDTLAIGNPFQYDVLACGKATVPCIVSPVTNIIGSGSTSTAQFSPFVTSKSDVRFQMLIHASEIIATGFDEGNIRGIYFDIPALTSNQTLTGLNIKMDCTSSDTLNTFQNLNTLVYSGNYTPIQGSNYFDFIIDYAWDGTSNLLVEFCFDNSTGTSDNAIAHSSTGFNSVVYDTSNVTSGCLLNAGIAGNLRPNFRLSTCRSLLHDIGNNFFDFSWTPSSSVINPTDYIAFVHPQVDTWYYVTLSDIYGICSSTATDSVFITVTPRTEGYFHYPVDTLCLYENLMVFPDSVTITPGIFGSTLPSSIDSITGAFTADISLYDSIFYITYTPQAICPDVDSFLIDVRGITPTVEYASNNLCPEDPINTPVILISPGGVFTSEIPGLIDPNTGAVNFSAMTAGNYVPILYTLTEWQCVTDTTEILFISPNCDPYTFNGFTPNNDGYNDYWYIEGIDKGPNEVIIFNRWGDLVWSAENYDNMNVVWRGTNSNGNNLPSGTYYYSITFEGRTFGGYIELSY